MRQCCQSNPLMRSCWVGTAAALELRSVVLVRNGHKLQLSNEPFCPGSGRWQGPGGVFGIGPEPLPGCHPGQNALEMGRLSGQCQGTAAWLVGQGLIAAEGFKRSSGKWVRVGRGDNKPCLSRAARGAVTCIAEAQRLHLSLLPSSWCISPVPPTPICTSLGAPGASAHTRQHKPPRSHQEPSLHLTSHHFPL